MATERKPTLLHLACCILILQLVSCINQPELEFSREQAIRRAIELAKQSAPEVGIFEARIDEATAELVTMAEIEKRSGGHSPNVDLSAPMWWVTVRGCFRYEGLPGPNVHTMYAAQERIFFFPARANDGMISQGQLIPATLVGVIPRSALMMPTPAC